MIFLTWGSLFTILYHIDRMVTETNTTFEDGAHIIYVNAQIKNNTALGKLMHDFSCTDAKFSVQGVQTRLKRNDRFEISDRVVN